MAVKLVALYAQPDDVEAFEKAYFETHVPLAAKMPKLRNMQVLKFKKNVMGGTLPYYMTAELTFDSSEELKAAMASPEGQAAAQNLLGFASKILTLLIAEESNPVATPIDTVSIV